MVRLMFNAQHGEILHAQQYGMWQWDPMSEMGASVQSDLDLLLPADKVLKITETRSA